MSPAGRSHIGGLLVRAEADHVPLQVSIALTERCNFRCPHCYVPDLSAPDRLSTRRALDLLEELAAAGCLFLTFTGGEVFLRQDWLTLARRARELGFKLRLFTNGFRINEETADQVAPLHATVEVSLPGLDASVFDEATGTVGGLERTLRGIELLRERGVRVLLKTVVSRLTADGIERLAAFASDVGADYLADARIVARRDGNRAPLGLRVEHGGRSVPGKGPEPHAAAEGAIRPVPPDRPLCAAGTRLAHIAANGDVLACTILPVAAGNILEAPFSTIWERSEFLQRLRALRVADLRECGSCALLAACGRCYAQALLEDGDLLGPSTWACENALPFNESHGAAAACPEP